jgi:cobalt/nickel transport system permease protein
LKPGGKLTWRAQVTGAMAGSLFLRSLERSDRIYMAMLARGYDGEVRSLPQASIRPAQWVVLAAGLTLLGFLVMLALVVY